MMMKTRWPKQAGVLLPGILSAILIWHAGAGVAKAACNAGNILYNDLEIVLSKDVVCVGGTVTATVTTDPIGANVTLTSIPSIPSKISITPTDGLPSPATFEITGVTFSDFAGDVPLEATIVNGWEPSMEDICTESKALTVLKVELDFQNAKMSVGKTIDPYNIPTADVKIGVVAGDSITFKAKLTPAVSLAVSDYVWSGAQSGNGSTIAITFANAINYAEGLSVLGCPNLVAKVQSANVPQPNQAAWALINPDAANTAQLLGVEAFNWAAANWASLGGVQTAHNCRADAARHCFWNLLMCLDFDMDIAHAEGAATAHERTNLESTPNSHNEIVMDLINNSVGRSLSAGYNSTTTRAVLQAAVISALNAGGLTILDDLPNANEIGLLKPSNQ